MANNTNAQAINYANGYARPTCDAVVTAYLTAKRALQVFAGEGIAAVIPNDANFIQDGATVASGQADGRTPITDAQVSAIMIGNLNSLVAFFEANSNIILNQFLGISVNAASRVS